MRDEIKALQEERVQIYEDYYNNIIPKRIPVRLTVPNRLIAERMGLDLVKYGFDQRVLDPGKRELAAMLYSDTNPFSGAGGTIIGRSPGVYELLNSQAFVMADTGFMQHPEVIGMLAEDYPDFIKDPIAVMFERIIPRHYKTFALNSVASTNFFMMALSLLRSYSADSAPMQAELMDEYGYYPGAPGGSSAGSVAPFDFLADLLRSFSEISKDVRRHPALLKDACDALIPYMFNWGMPAAPNPRGAVGVPLHMPTYMRAKDFSELWLPSFQKMLEQWAARGVRASLFCEHDWTHLLDAIQDMPAGTDLRFEYGDYRNMKEKTGKKFMLSGMFPLVMVGRSTKQEMLDKAKEMLDVLMPGGGYIFFFDKGPLTLADINLDNYQALGEFIRDYAVYDNAGETFGHKLNEENYTIDTAIETLPKSPYLYDWDTFSANYPLVPDSSAPLFKRLQKESLDNILQMLR
ncbi:MAG: hypothetical protein FWG10_09785 [Eubacteriaceae bacterium]|nr:hypothetical protein [Eubacteriaceae bacterium]